MASVEVCVESVAGVRAARAAGARRVELCCALGEGGLTPSAGLLAAALGVGGIEVGALIRPRPGDFLYSAEEFAVCLADVELARQAGATGVAVGVLTQHGAVDAERTAELVARARPLGVTFHRAFDFVPDRAAALETLVQLGVERVLTAGGAGSAWSGRGALEALVRAAGGRIRVVAAGGVRPEHARELVRASGVDEVHLAAPLRVESAMLFRATEARLASASRGPEAFAHWETDEAGVRALVAAVAAD